MKLVLAIYLLFRSKNRLCIQYKSIYKLYINLYINNKRHRSKDVFFIVIITSYSSVRKCLLHIFIEN